MHFLTEAEWREHRTEVASLLGAFVTLARGLEAFAPFITGVQTMSTAVAELKQEVAGLSEKFDQVIAGRESANAAKLADLQTEHDAAVADLKADIDALSAKLDAAMPAAPVAPTTEQVAPSA